MVVSSDVNKFLNNINKANGGGAVGAGKVKSGISAADKTGKPENGGEEIKSFGEILRHTYALNNLNNLNNLNKTVLQGLTFSKHAKQRLAQRNIKIDGALIDKIDGALKKAAGKNIKNVLLISDDAAFIVSVDNNVVVTAMNTDEMKENVITKIDGTVII